MTPHALCPDVGWLVGLSIIYIIPVRSDVIACTMRGEVILLRENILAPHLKLANGFGARGLGGALTFHCYVLTNKYLTSKVYEVE